MGSSTPFADAIDQLVRLEREAKELDDEAEGLEHEARQVREAAEKVWNRYEELAEQVRNPDD